MIIGTMVCLPLSVVCAALLTLTFLHHFAAGTNASNRHAHNNTLLWIPNKSGLFSQFFQLRQMVRHAHRYNRRLVVANFTSSHFADALSLCNIFDLPAAITCDKMRLNPERNRTLSTCHTSFSARVFRGNASSLCYKGYLFGKKGLVTEHKRLLLITGEPKVRLRPKYALLYSQHVEPRLAALAQQGPYTVVHWRRGDQLWTRCKKHWVGLKDTSANCRNAEDFVAEIRGGLGGNRSEIVFVATNERNESSLAVLRAVRGFYVFSEVLKAQAPQLSELDAFVLEALAMLRAPTLLSMGISTINDLVEADRAARGLSYCSKSDDPDLNWCTLRSRH